MPSTNKITTDPEEIKAWVEERGGRPARTRDLLNIDFGQPDRDLEEISWDEFFNIFEKNHLAFQYEEGDLNDEANASFRLLDRNAPAKEELEDEDEEKNIEL